VSDWSKKALIS